MKTKTKGLIAAAAGVALLAGSAGTFALWFDTADLGANVNTIATGQLALEDATVAGKWVWTQVSHTLPGVTVGSPFGVAAEFDEDGEEISAFIPGKLVPADQIQWQWSDEQLSVLLSGDTIVANLYLDGVPLVDLNKLEPLVITVDGSALNLVDIDSENNTGSFIIASNLTAANHDLDSFSAPTITVTFPETVTNKDGQNMGPAYVIDLSDAEIRLQQVISTPASVDSPDTGSDDGE